MKDKNILITGGLGFIGSHLANELIKENKVTIIDNLTNENINKLNEPERDNLKIMKENIFDINLDGLTSYWDYMSHFASSASVRLSIAQPVECADINFKESVNWFKTIL